ARRDTRREAARLRRLSPLQTLENQSQIWGIRCHSCTGREGLPPSWKLSYKTEILRFTRESRFSFNQRIARILMCYQKLHAHRGKHERWQTRSISESWSKVLRYGIRGGSSIRTLSRISARPTSGGPTSAGRTSGGPPSARPPSAGPTSARPTSARLTSAGPPSAGPT